MSDAVKVHKIEKTFKNKTGKNSVLKNISFSLKAGELLIVTGKNGAGKTTLLKILAGLLLPDSGKMNFLGKDALKHTKDIRKITGFMSSEERNLYWKLTGRQNLEFFAALYGIDNKTVADRLERLTEILELKEFLDKPVED
ncbi:MAG: ATP-binding cassette domain-containing protein, partial [Candidatus Firestonebacteria bacterium]